MFRAIVDAVSKRLGRADKPEPAPAELAVEPQPSSESQDAADSEPADSEPPVVNGEALDLNGHLDLNGDSLSEAEIQTCAYLRWEKAGKPQGMDDRFWQEAKEELLLKRCNGKFD
jgi:Protein of unknown function (DUF2934)